MMSQSGLGVVDEDGSPVVLTLQEELKDQGTQEFQLKHFETAAEVYSEALLLGALQRLCFAMTCHARIGEDWVGSGARLPHAAGSTSSQVDLIPARPPGMAEYEPRFVGFALRRAPTPRAADRAAVAEHTSDPKLRPEQPSPRAPAATWVHQLPPRGVGGEAETHK